MCLPALSSTRQHSVDRSPRVAMSFLIKKNHVLIFGSVSHLVT